MPYSYLYRRSTKSQLDSLEFGEDGIAEPPVVDASLLPDATATISKRKLVLFDDVRHRRNEKVSKRRR
jgi:hypothetical protein